MDEETLKIIFKLIGLCMLVALLIGTIYEAEYALEGRITVKDTTSKCYDRFGSEINGLTCNKKMACGAGWLFPKCDGVE